LISRLSNIGHSDRRNHCVSNHIAR